MSLSASDERTGAAAYLAVALILASVALSLAWLQVEGVVDSAASQTATLGVGAMAVVVVLRAVEPYAG